MPSAYGSVGSYLVVCFDFNDGVAVLTRPIRFYFVSHVGNYDAERVMLHLFGILLPSGYRVLNVLHPNKWVDFTTVLSEVLVQASWFRRVRYIEEYLVCYFLHFVSKRDFIETVVKKEMVCHRVFARSSFTTQRYFNDFHNRRLLIYVI